MAVLFYKNWLKILDILGLGLKKSSKYNNVFSGVKLSLGFKGRPEASQRVHLDKLFAEPSVEFKRLQIEPKK